MFAQDAEGIKHAVQHLQAALGSNAYLVGDSLTLADVIIYVALLPVQVGKHGALSYCTPLHVNNVNGFQDHTYIEGCLFSMYVAYADSSHCTNSSGRCITFAL